MKWLEYIKENYTTDKNFYNIWIVVNNSVRKKQIEDSIIREMAEGSSIIPPQVLDYQLAFLYLAAEICLGIYNKDKINEYSQEWIEFFTYKIAESVISETISKTENSIGCIPNELRETPNLIRHLAKDLRNFIRDTVYYVIDIENINIPQNNKDFITTYFFEGLKKYKELEDSHNVEKNKTFLTPIHAYRSLYKKLDNNVDIQNMNLPKVIIIEDFDDLEPIFKSIVDKLTKKNLIKIEKFNKFNDKSVNDKNLEIKAFVNSIDETEFVVYQTIELIKKQIPAEDIGIVVCNEEIGDLLNLTFHKYGVVLDKRTPLYLSSPFRAVFSFFKIYAKNQNNKNDFITVSQTDIENIFNNECTKFYIQDGYCELTSHVLSTGKRFYNDPIDVLTDVKKELNKNEVKKCIENFVNLINNVNITSPNFLINIIENLLNFKKIYGTDLINKFFSSIIEMNKILNNLNNVDKNKKIEICYDLFLIAAKREYIDTKVKEENNRWEHFIPIVSPEQADNITAKYLFICGLDGNLDKKILTSMPEYLINLINKEVNNQNQQKIPNAEEIIKKLYRKLDNAIKYAENVYLSFSYYDLSNKEKGISNFLYQPKFDIHQKVKEFKKGYEIHIQDENTQSQNIKQYAEIFQDNLTIKVYELLEKVGKKQENTIKLNVKYDLTEFIFCPRKYLFDLIAEVTKIKPPFIETPHIKRGSFWHKVFAEAAKDDRFNSANDNDIFECLKEKFQNVKQNFKLEEFEPILDNNYIENVILKTFAQNEAKHKSNGYKTLSDYVEKEIEVNLNINNHSYKLKGKVDRIDIKNEDRHILIIDYKIGKKNIKFLCEHNAQFYLENNKITIQLGLYAYILSKVQDNLGNQIIINQNTEFGIVDLYGDRKVSTIMYKRKNEFNRFMELIGDSVNKFDEFINKPVKEGFNYSHSLVSNLYKDDNILPTEYSSCHYCDYRPVCLGLISFFKDDV